MQGARLAGVPLHVFETWDAWQRTPYLVMAEKILEPQPGTRPGR